jgi:hypothetical protein
MPVDGWGDTLNPFQRLAVEAGRVLADGWVTAMLGLWNAGLWVLRLVLSVMDGFLSPDVSEDGPGRELYRATFWLAGALVLIMVLVQLGVAAMRRDGKGLARLLVGCGQFVVVWAGWIAYGVAVLAACSGITRALMRSLLRVGSWSEWEPWPPFDPENIANATVATVLGLMGLLLWLAAIGHLLVMLTRAGALMVLVATTPISAAGLVSDAGGSWFWKSLRWFHAAALTPVLMVVVLGVGMQMTTGVATGFADKTQAAVGTALPGVVLILIGCFAPLALFKLLAFVDPGTPSGAALRQGLAAQGGLQGLLAGSGGDRGLATAATTDNHGRSQGESAGQEATDARFAQAQAGLFGTVGGAVGKAAAQGLGVMGTVGAKTAAIGADLTNQMGVGHTSHHPDFSRLGSRSKATNSSRIPSSGPNPDTREVNGSNPTGDAQFGAATNPPATASSSGSNQPAVAADAPLVQNTATGAGQETLPGLKPAGPRGGTGAVPSAAGGAEAAAAVPVVPV